MREIGICESPFTLNHGAAMKAWKGIVKGEECMWARANMGKNLCGASLKLYRGAPLSTSLLLRPSAHSFRSCEGNMVTWVHLHH